ncbi:MAG: hypothetical protein KJ646_01450 [Nanoarchaeota archaeon]|nr:hypothetical protein [Nanoarchaeota archaeon]MBU4116297.1 hypothetical protein [Nanoarchaeota archaeon]
MKTLLWVFLLVLQNFLGIILYLILYIMNLKEKLD